MDDRVLGSRLDRKQLPILAALAWARTRDAEITHQAESVTPIRLSLVIARWAQDHAEEGRALDGLWMSRDEAENALLAHLRSGAVEAQGVLRDSFLGAFHAIPSASWHVLQLNMAGQPYAEGLIGGRYERWDHVLLDAEHVVSAFPRTHATRLEKLAADRADAKQRFDPMAEPRWSVPMTVAWIATREVSDVQRAWDEFRHEVGEEPADLEHLSPIEWQAVTDAWRDLRRAAEAGTVAAQGIDEQSGHGIALSAAVWRNMAFVSKPAGMTCVPKGSKSGYRDVTFASTEISGLWPVEAPDDARAPGVNEDLEDAIQEPPEVDVELAPVPLVEMAPKADDRTSDVPQRFSTAAAEAAFERIVEQWRRNGSKVPERPTRDGVVADLQAELPGLSVPYGRKLWAERAPIEWRSKGPRGPRNSATE